MLIAITGATGFVGRHFVPAALRAGHTVRALVRSPHEIPGAELIRGELDDRAALHALVQRAEVVVHLAALGVQSRDRQRDRMVRVNVVAPLELLEEAAGAGARQLVVTGTCLEYSGWGRLPDAPWPGAAQLCDEASPLESADPYGATKAAGGLLLRAFAKQLALPVQYLRIASLYGPGDDPDKFLPSAVQAAIERRAFEMTGGEQVREWLHVEDAAAAILAVAERNVGTGGEVLNIGTGEGRTLLDVIQSVFRGAGASPEMIRIGAHPYRSGEVHHLVMSVARARSQLGYRVRSPEEGFRELIAAAVRSKR